MYFFLHVIFRLYFVLLNIFNGGATAPLYSLGVVYLNENIKQPKATFYEGYIFIPISIFCYSFFEFNTFYLMFYIKQ